MQRHGLEVVLPVCKDRRYSLLFAAMFGALPAGSEVADIYEKALGGKRKEYMPLDYTQIFNERNLFPLRATRHKLETRRNSYSWDSHLF